MKIIILLCTVFLLSLNIHAAIPISTAEELVDLMNSANPSVDWALDYELTADLDMTGKVCKPIGDGDGTFGTTPFTGSLNGNGYMIKNLIINGAPNSYQGLFGYASNASIKNLSLDNLQLSGGVWVGGLCGCLDNTDVQYCNVQGIIYGSTVVGILCGAADNGSTVQYCYSEGNIIGTGSFPGMIGGFAGANSHSTISYCYSTGSVTGSAFLSGFCASNANDGIIKDCYCSGNVVGGSFVSGFCSSNDSYIGFCYSISKPTGFFTYGFIASDYDGMYECNYWDIESSGTTDGVGGVIPDPEGVYGLQTDQFSDPSSFQNDDCGFDFAGTWMMAGGRPVLTELTIPTLSEWAVIAFIGLLAGVGGWFVWRKML